MPSLNKTYIYPRFKFLALIVFLVAIYGCAMAAYGFLAEAVGSEDLLYGVITAVVGMFFGFCAVWLLVMNVMNLMGVRKVITRDEDLTIRNLSSTKTIRWEDVEEFGTYTLAQGRVRRFYLKERRNGDKRIEVCTHSLDDLKDLIDTIFLKATRAKFIIVENVAWIPFTKKIRFVPWERRNQSFL